MPITDDQSWHLDRRVPLALILAILLQTGGWIWFAASLNERVSTLESIQVVRGPQAERLTRVEEQLHGIKESVAEIKAIILSEFRRQRLGDRAPQ